MHRVLAVIERVGCELDDSAFELLGAARQLGAERVAAVLFGQDLATSAAELARGFDEVFVFDDPRLGVPDGDFQARLLASFVQRQGPDLVLFAHTNLSLGTAPLLAGILDAPLLVDCLELALDRDHLTCVRALHGGKVHERVSVGLGAPGVLVTLRPGAYPAAPPAGEASGEVHPETLPAEIEPRLVHVETLTLADSGVDLRAAERLVAVGRGIDDAENLELVQSLADALGAELVCTRPVVDKHWMEQGRQVGTSGITVKPRLYLTVGVSGSFQHLGGVKGKPWIAAINKDPAAPIFSVAEVGIVGDLFELVPALEDKLRERKG